MPDAHHPIQLAARLTGLSPHVIRIWEQRYQAVEPRRTSANHRLYSPTDLDRLGLLRDVTRAGHNIGQVARLTNGELRRLLTRTTGLQGQASRTADPTSAGASLADAGLAAIQALDALALNDLLNRACTTLGNQGALHLVIAPLTQALGDRWREGRLTAAHEHFATGQMRAFLENLTRPFGSSRAMPELIVATPAGQLHEMGALLAAALAANLGWSVTSLGASLPAAEIAGAARQKQARAVALSLVYPEDDPSLPGELTQLRESLPAETALLVGGRATPAYRDVLTRLGATLIDDLKALGQALDRLRRPMKPATR